MAVNCSPFGPKPQFELSDGTPAVGNKLFFYVAGSVNTKQNTYTDSTGGVANTNPIVLNALGQPTTQIWFTAGQSYKVVFAPSTDTDPPTSPIWTIDNLVGINDTTSTLDQWVVGPAPTYVSATSFTLAGDQTSTFTVGRRVKTTNSGGTVYSTILTSVFGAVTTITLTNDSGTLDSGLSAVSYGLLSSVNPSMPYVPVPGANGTLAMADSSKAYGVAYTRFPYTPGGRVTVTTGVPVLTSDVSAQGTVYYTPYQHDGIQIYDGTGWVSRQFVEMSQTTSDTTKSPAAVANNSNYDMFVWMDGTTMRCTRGPAWSSLTSRGTGAGTTELELFEGRYVNKNAITNGPAARRGLWVGSVNSNGTATIDWIANPAAAAGGGNARLCVWNMYNRVSVTGTNRDSTDSWTYNSATLRSQNNNTNNRVSYLHGLSEDSIDASHYMPLTNPAGDTGVVAIGIDSTSAASGTFSRYGDTATNAVATPAYSGYPGVGFHFVQPLEANTSAGGAITFYGDRGVAYVQSETIVKTRM